MEFKVWLGNRHTTFKVTKIKINGEEVTNLNTITILPALSGPAIILSEIFILGPNFSMFKVFKRMNCLHYMKRIFIGLIRSKKTRIGRIIAKGVNHGCKSESKIKC